MKNPKILFAFVGALLFCALTFSHSHAQTGLRGPNEGSKPCGITAPVFSTHQTGKEIQFQIHGYTSSDGVKFLIDFGDGTHLITDQPLITHLYQVYGSYPVNVVVMADCGSDSYSRVVNVTPPLPGDQKQRRPVSTR